MMFELSEEDKVLADKMFEYELNGLPYEEYVELFQALVDNGWAWILQGSYGRAAFDLIEAGEVVLPG